MRLLVLILASNLIAQACLGETPTFWNFARQVTFSPATKDRSEVGALREHNPATAERQGAREFSIELEKVDSAEYYLVVARDRRQLESFLETGGMQRVDDFNESYWEHFVESFAATRGGARVSSDHLEELRYDGRLDYFYDGCLDQPHLLSSMDGVVSGYQDNAERSASYAQQADLTTFLLDRYPGLFIRFFDLDGDDKTDIQVSRASFAAQSSFATSLLYDNPMLGNELNTSPLSVVYPLLDATRPGRFSPRRNVYHCWVKVMNGIVATGDIRSPFIPDAVRVAVAGDSFSSGEGAPNPWFGTYNTFNWGRDSVNYYAHRSYLSHWHLAMKRAHRRWYNNNARFHKTGIYHDDQSWSGAIIYDFDPTDRWNVRPTSWADYYGNTNYSANMRKGATTFARQINEMKRANYDLLCFSHGGNDAAFADILGELLFWDDYDDIVADWQSDMNENGRYRDEFAEHYDYSNYTNEQAPPLEGAFDRVKERLLSVGSDSFNGRLFENFLISRYPNPVGYPTGSRWDRDYWDEFQRCGEFLGIEPLEADIIVDDFMGLINGPVSNLREAARDRVTVISANGSSSYPIYDWHQRGSMGNSPDRVFARFPGDDCWGIIGSGYWAEADERPEVMYWFHPNKQGQELLWDDDQEEIERYFDSAYTRSRYSAQEHPIFDSTGNRVDLFLELAELENIDTADGTSSLKLNLVVKNLSSVTTSLPVNMLMKFNFNGASISIPVYNYITGQNIVIPPLEPGESFVFNEVVFDGSEQCTGTDFLVSQLRIFTGRAPYILDNLEDYDPQVGYAAWWLVHEAEGDNETFLKKLCGKVNLWNLHYGRDTKFSFYLPWDPNEEINELVDNNFGVELSTWDINEQVVEDLKDCYRISLLDCYRDQEWLRELLKTSDDIVHQARVETRMRDLMREVGLLPSVVYPILDTVEEGAPRALVPVEDVLTEATAMLEFERKGLLGGAPLVMFPTDVRDVFFEFPEHPSLKLSYSDSTRINELFVFDGSILKADLVFNKNGKVFRRGLDLKLPFQEYGVKGLGNAPSNGWGKMPLSLSVPDSFSGENLQFVAVDPLTNTVLKSVETKGYLGTLDQFFQKLYFSEGSAKLTIRQQSSPAGKGYWLNNSTSVGALKSEIKSIDEKSSVATIKITLEGWIEPELLQSEISQLSCKLKDDSSSHRIDITLERVAALDSSTFTLDIRYPLEIARSQFHILEVTGKTGDVLATAPLGSLPLLGDVVSKVAPYLYLEDSSVVAISAYKAGELPAFVYRDPMDGFIPKSVKMNVEGQPSAPGLYSATVTVSNSRGLESKKDFVLEIREDPVPDSDGDGLDDEIELTIGTDPLKKDTDEDGISDRLEFVNGFVNLVSHPTNGSFRFVNNDVVELSTIIGKRYQIETSVDLINWEPFGEQFQASEKSKKIQISGKERSFFLRANQF